MSSARSEHLDTRYHNIRMRCAENVVILHHLSSDQRHADILMKPLECRSVFVPYEYFDGYQEFMDLLESWVLLYFEFLLFVSTLFSSAVVCKPGGRVLVVKDVQ